jgi:hypothetical protein
MPLPVLDVPLQVMIVLLSALLFIWNPIPDVLACPLTLMRVLLSAICNSTPLLLLALPTQFVNVLLLVYFQGSL